MQHMLEIEILSRYVDKRCSPEETTRVESHIAACPDCGSDFSFLRNTVTALGRVEPLELPTDFDLSFNRRLDEAIRAKEALKARQAPVLARTIAAFAVVAIVALSVVKYCAVITPTVLISQGRVQIYDKSLREWQDVLPERKLQSGDIIRTAKAAKLKIQVPEMYTVMLKENSEIEIAGLTRRALKGSASFNLKYGQMFIDINRQKFKGSRFRVRTPAAETEALGTKFALDVKIEKELDKTWVGVLDGKVKVTSIFLRPDFTGAKKSVVVKAGQKTEVLSGLAPVYPQELLEKDWQIMQELYQLGQVPQVALLISAGRKRVRELLRPCSIYIYDKEPRTIPLELERAVGLVNEAIKTGEEQKHLEAIKRLEEIVKYYPDRRYNAQFLLFIGAYYNYIGHYGEAISSFKEVVDKYPESTLASLAQAAIGMIYEEGLHDYSQAREAYNKVLYYYPDSPEVFIAEQALEAKKVR